MPTHQKRFLPVLLAFATLLLGEGCTTIKYSVERPVDAATPVISPAAGTYTSTQTITITDTTPGAAIYYTTNPTLPTPSSTPYTGPITVSTSQTIEAIAVARDFLTSPAATAAYVINFLPAATPVFTPSAGTYSSTQQVAITDATHGASIYYTTNGSTPTTSSTLYTAPIPVSTSETLEAIAIAPAYTQSAVATAAYLIALPLLPTPTFNPPPLTYASPQSVTISDTTPSASIYYTTNGTTPTAASTPYTNPITVATSETIEAIAVAPGYTSSPVATAAYIISLQQAAPPTFNPPAGFYTSAPTVTITDATPGASIYFTDDGTTPTPSSTLYTSPVTVNPPEVLEALAVATGYTTSTIARADYASQPSYSCSTPGPDIICTVAGTGIAGYTGDGGPATSAELTDPWGITLDSRYNLYIADPNGHVVRKVTTAGIISTIAGTGVQGYTGDGGPATSAELRGPDEVALDSANNIYIVDEGCSCVRMVNSAGMISTVAGNGTTGKSGDGGLATNAQMYYPVGIKFDASGNYYIADYQANVVRMVNTQGIISTVAGDGSVGYGGDGGPATKAELNGPYDIAFDASGNMYISDAFNHAIRRVNPAGIISTFAAGAFTDPHGLAFDPAGNLYTADIDTNRVYQITPAGAVAVFAGTGVAGFGGDGGPATKALLSSPETVNFDPAGNAFIGDWANHRVREVSYSTAFAPTFTPPAGTYPSAQTVTIASATTAASIYYTTDGSAPTTSSILYTGPISVSTTETLKAIAAAPGYTTSPVSTAAYIIQ